MSSRPPSSSVPRKPSAVAANRQAIDWLALEQISHRDPGGRGLASYTPGGMPLDAGELEKAAIELAQSATKVGIVTGFCVVVNDQISAETDGPPGALFLARALTALGIEVELITDRGALPLVEVGCDAWKLDRGMIVEFPLPGANASASSVDRWLDEHLGGGQGPRWSHLIAIERAGPSHTAQSLAAQVRRGAPPIARFDREVPASDRDCCHNMRGESIDLHTAPIHRMFDEIRQRSLPVVSIGIGDGGNEIGMGSFAWETLVEAVGTPVAPRIVSRVATDFTLIAGVSNWAGYALALAVARLLDAGSLCRDWNAAGEQRLIEQLVAAGAVDGITLRRAPTVDSLALEDYLDPLVQMRALLDL